MSKLQDPTSKLKGPDLALYQELSAKRGRIDGMYRSLLNHPELTRHVSDLGTYLRFGSTLPGNIREFIILYAAHKMQVMYEWEKHQQPAHEAGLKAEIIDALQKNLPLPQPYQMLSEAVEYAMNLKNIPEELQNQIIQEISVKGLIELVILSGFYRMIAGVITAFDVPLPPKS